MDDTGTFYGSNQSRRQRQNAAANSVVELAVLNKRISRLIIFSALTTLCCIGAGVVAVIGAWFR